MIVYVLEIGEFFCHRNTIKVFASDEAAKAAIPAGFKEKDIGSYFYADNEKTEEWLTIERLEVEK